MRVELSCEKGLNLNDIVFKYDPEKAKDIIKQLEEKEKNLLIELDLLRENHVGSEKPAIDYEYFRNIGEFVKNIPALQDQWNMILNELTTKAGVSSFCSYAVSIDLKNLRALNGLFYHPTISSLVINIEDLEQKLLHYNYLKISDALAELLKTSPEFSKNWREFFTLVKLFADQEDIIKMGG